jgi:hypothetical protein
MHVRRGTTGTISTIACAVLLQILLANRLAVAADCSNGSFSSTFELIQAAVFEKHSCADAVCHGVAKSGGLDLRPDAAYDNLVDVDAQTVPGQKRVLAGQSAASLLYVNLAAKTRPEEWKAPLRAMPPDLAAPLSADELEAMRLWIEQGAPRAGVVRGTDALLNACLPPPQPIEIKPLPPPAPGTGVQITMPRWFLGPHSEREICFASYYDITEQVPPELRLPDGTFRYKYHQTRQDPLSHHMVPILYRGSTLPTSPVWGAWQCRGGAHDGDACDPLNTTACGEGVCGSEPANSVGCIGYGPGDGGIGFSEAGISITQQTAEEFPYPPGVYGSLPMKGLILWSSHAFNLTDEPGRLEAWLNFVFAHPEEEQTPATQIFDASAVFKMDAPAFKTDEPCNIHVFPPDARVFELSSHMHKHGKRWRTFLGAFTCASGPAAGQACSPFGYDFVSPDVCAGAPCTSTARLHVGDCDLDGSVTVDELITSVGVALGTTSIDACREADADGDWEVSIDEIISGVNAGLTGVPARIARDPQDSLLYVSLIYNDPIVLRFKRPMVMPGSASSPDDRSVTYCALYDNGFTNPSDVKARSTSPDPPIAFPGIGGKCQTPTNCTQGRVEAPCSGRNEAQRNASCDTTTGAGDGLCDACPLVGGVTTSDEMFILLGQYYVP